MLEFSETVSQADMPSQMKSKIAIFKTCGVLNV
jgi:hypothetical protein